MNCEEIELQLSELLDQALDGERSTNLREHLAACPRCREEFAALSECRQLVANLSIVDPPVGLVTRVMAEVGERVGRPSLWQRWFIPLRFTMPLQATALVLIGVLSVYLYQKEEPKNQPSAPSTAEKTGPMSGDKKEAARSEPAPGKRSPDVAQAIPHEPAPAKPVEARKVENGFAEIEKFKSTPIPAQGVTTSQEGFAFPGDARRFGAGAAPFANERFFSLQEPIPDYELVIRQRPAQRIEQTTPGETGKQEERYSQGGAPVNILWYRVPFDRYEQFKKELAGQAILESEIPVAVKEKEASFIADRPLTIKVTVLPSAEK